MQLCGKKILYFMDNYTKLGGAAHTTLRQAILMKKAGLQVEVVVSDYVREVCKDYIRICEKYQIPIHIQTFSVSNQPEGIDVCGIWEHYETLEAFVAEQQPDILHSVQLNPTLELVSRRLGIPHAMNIYYIENYFWRFSYEDVFPKYHICDSQYYANIWKELIHTHSYCVRTVVDFATDKVLREKELAGKKPLRIVVVGNVCERKNQLEVIKAFHKLIAAGSFATLDLYGNIAKEYGERCEEYIKDNTLQEYVQLKGFCEDMQAVYQNYDVLICGSRMESYPNVISEALASALLIVSTPVAGVPEIIINKYNGYLTKGYEAQDFYESLCDCIEDIKCGRSKIISEEAWNTYMAHHTQEAVTNSLLACYEDIINHYHDSKVAKSYGIEDFRQEYKRWYQWYKENQEYFDNPQFAKKSLWKIKHIYENIMSKQSEITKYYIWGTGKYGTIYWTTLKQLLPDWECAGFIDSYKTGQMEGIRICSFAEICEERECAIIFVGVINGMQDVMVTLEKEGYEYNKSYYMLQPVEW